MAWAEMVHDSDRHIRSKAVVALVLIDRTLVVRRCGSKELDDEGNLSPQASFYISLETLMGSLGYPQVSKPPRTDSLLSV